MPNKKKNTKSDQAINFLRGWLGDEKRGNAPVAKFVRASTQYQKDLDKARGKSRGK